MKLFRTAFWLGITICCLPSTNSQPIAPEADPKGSQRRFPVTAGNGRLCAWELNDSERHGTLVKPGQQRTDSSLSRKPVTYSQDTLIHSDLTVPWRGSGGVNELRAKRAI
jgi:hypothetical protein